MKPVIINLGFIKGRTFLDTLSDQQLLDITVDLFFAYCPISVFIV